MSTAESARAAVDRHPFLRHALRAGVLNYAAAAEFLDAGDDADAVATALRRYREELPDYDSREADARVTMQSGVGLVDADEDSKSEGPAGNAVDPADALLAVGGAALLPDTGSLTAVLATGGGVDAAALAAVCTRLDADGVAVEVAGVAAGTLVVAVPRRAGASTVRTVESALSTVPA